MEKIQCLGCLKFIKLYRGRRGFPLNPGKELKSEKDVGAVGGGSTETRTSTGTGIGIERALERYGVGKT